MFSNPEQFTSATTFLFASHIPSFQALSSKTFEGVEKAIALNIAAAIASLEQSIAVTTQLSSAKDGQDFFSVAAAQAKLTAENMASYRRHLTDIAAGIRAEFRQATEAQVADAKSKTAALVVTVTQNAPAGSENAVAIFKMPIGNASSGYEYPTKASKQAVETVEFRDIEATQNVEEAVSKAGKK